MDMKKILNILTVFLVGWCAICAIGTYGTPLFAPYALAFSAWLIVMIERLFPSKHEHE
jgi:hypothetical protein